MSYRDTLLFKAIGAVTLRVELFFSDANWRNVSPFISEPIRVVVFFVVGASLIILTHFAILELFQPRPWRGTPAFFLLAMLYVPQFSPVFCFFRPTIRQFPKRKNELRVLAGTAERAKVYHVGLHGLLFFGIISLTYKDLGARAAMWQFVIIAPFCWMAFLQSFWRDSRWMRAARLAKKLTPDAPIEMINAGSWSNKFAHSYLFEVCFFLSMIVAQILVQ